MNTPVHVVSLYRYPVKSLLGESVEFLDLDERGCAGDRRWSVRTAAGKLGSGKNTRRMAAVEGLLGLRAMERDGRVKIAFPDGEVHAVDTAEAARGVSRHVRQPVTLAVETTVSHFDDGPVSLLGLASVAAVAEDQGEPVDPVRFRANIVLGTTAPFVEEEWLGHDLQLGNAVVRVTRALPRCRMVDMETADLPAQPGNLATTGRLNDARLGVVATVVSPGRIAVGDVATLHA